LTKNNIYTKLKKAELKIEHLANINNINLRKRITRVENKKYELINLS